MTDSVMIFTPTARLTVTIEQPSDEVELHLHAGGQGIWQARMVALLGVPVTLCACVGGEVGRALVPLLHQDGITVRTMGREATSGWYVHDRRHGERTVIAESPTAPLNRPTLAPTAGSSWLTSAANMPGPPSPAGSRS